MLQFMILLFVLCTVPGNGFPQRNNPNHDGNFDFETYMEHFKEFPSDQTVNDHPRVAHSQDYRYIPLLGEIPEYIPPLLQRGHFPHPNIPRRSSLKERAWHSSYQDGNFQHAGMELAANGIRPQNPMESHREWNHQRIKPHLKMQDFGPHVAPVVVEAFLKNGERVNKNHDHKSPIVDEPSKGKPVFIKEHHRDPVEMPIKDYDSPDVEALVKKWRPVSIDHAHKHPGGIDSITNKHESYMKDYEAPVVLEAWTKRVSPSHNRKHSHKRPVLKHNKRPISKHDQKHEVKSSVTVELPVRSSYFEDYETPLVLEAFTKEKLSTSSKSHSIEPFKNKPAVKKTTEKNPILQPDWKPIDTIDPEDYETPVVIEVLTKKESVPSKKHGDKKRVEHEKNPISKTVGKQMLQNYPDDYELPEVVEVLTKSETVSKKKHGHKTSTKAEKAVKKHENNPIMKHSEKPVMPTYPGDYDLPVVLEALTKDGTVHTKNHGHKKPIEAEQVVKKHEKNPIVQSVRQPIDSSYPGDYDLPVVVEALTKEGTVHKKEHSHKKPIKMEQVVKKHEKNPIVEPVRKPVVPSYPDDYDLPVVVEALTKEGTVHKKVPGHKKPIEAEQVVKKHEKNPIVQSVRQPIDSSYPGDYDLPVVVEALTKEGTVHKKEHSRKKPIKMEQVVKKHEKNPIVEPVRKPVVPSYPDDYDLPVVVEALTKEGTVHKKEHGHKKPIKADLVEEKHDKRYPITKPKDKMDYEAPGVVETWKIEGSTFNKENSPYKQLKHGEKKNDHEKPVKPMQKPMDVEYESKKFEDNPPIYMQDEYDSTISIDKFNHKLKSYEYANKQVVQRPSSKDPFVTKNDDYEQLHTEPIYHENTKGLGFPIDKTQWSNNKFEVSESKRFKRQVELDDEDDYDLPVVIEVETKTPQAAKHKPTLVEPEDHEYDYDLPVVIEVETKKEIVTSHKKPEFIETIDREANYDTSAVDHTSKVGEEYGSNNVKKPSKINQNSIGHETQNVKALTKGKHSTKKHSHKHVDKMVEGKPNMGKKQSKEPIAINKDEILNDVYNQNEREHKNIPAYLPTRVDPNVEDGYEKPVYNHGYEFDMHERPVDYFDEENSIMEEIPIHDSFEPMDISDTEDVLDSLSINREGPDGREIPVVDVLAVKDHANEHNAGIKVMAFNKDNGNVEVINIGHEHSNHNIEDFEDSNHGIEDFEESGSGGELDERSSVPRSLFPMNSNAWSFMTHIQAQERRKFKPCFTPRNETGNCMPIQMCPIPNLRGPIDEFLRNVCIIDEVFIGICCPEFPVESVRVDWGQFVNSNPEPLVDNVQSSQESLECGKLPSSFQNEDTWPWMAPLISSASDRVFCGGALINEQYVLTAAHCTSRIPRNRILVRLGSPDSQTGAVEFTVVEIKRHAQYNPRTMQNDIALLKLGRKVPLGNFRRLVCIPDGDEDNVGENAVLLRWHRNPGSGVESLPVIPNQECQNRLGTLIGDSVLCTEPRNEETTCNADSGAPLVASSNGKFKIIGVLTWNRNDCDGRHPSVFTRIASYRKWIKNHAN